LISSLKEELNELESEVPNEEAEEVIVDLLSLNYMGPIYGQVIAKIPDKIGRHESTEHPIVETRIGYIIDYIRNIDDIEANGDLNQIESDQIEGDNRQQTLDTATNHHPIYNEIQQGVEEELSNVREAGEEDYTIDNFAKLNGAIVERMDEEGIPTYKQEREKTKHYLGMPRAKVTTVKTKLEKFLLDSPPGREIALPMKQISFYLLLAVEDIEKKSLQEVTLESFKKWYVTRKTRDSQVLSD